MCIQRNRNANALRTIRIYRREFPVSVQIGKTMELSNVSLTKRQFVDQVSQDRIAPAFPRICVYSDLFSVYLVLFSARAI